MAPLWISLIKAYNLTMNLAVKYRPKTFKDVVNQKHVVITLQNALRTMSIAPAYMLTGPRGVGKTTIARIFAKGLNCVQGVTPDPCGECEICKEIEASRSIDVLEIDGASNRGIDQIRELRENVRFTPLKSRYKVIIIDEVHMLTQEAFNALLKTLEEPPKNVVFIFATTEPNRVPETVRSRTLRFDLRPLEKNAIKERLLKVIKTEKETGGANIEYESEEVLDLIAEAASGGLRDALSLLEQAHVYSQGIITVEKVKELTGMLPQEIYLQLFEYLLDKKSTETISLVEKIIAQGYDLEDFQKGLLRATEQLLKAFYEVESNVYTSLAKRFNEYQLLFLLRTLRDMELDIKTLPNPKIFVDFHLLRLIKLESELELTQNVNFLNGKPVELPGNSANGVKAVSNGELNLSGKLQDVPSTQKEGSEKEDFIAFLIQKLKLREVTDGSF
ncbi:MAG: DNA polymerase III subunit gamma/tau [candidate division WOR-3 bacterium]